MATARGKAELSDIAADHAREDYEIAKLTAKQFAPDFIQPGLEKTRLREILKQRMSIDQKNLMAMQHSAGPALPPETGDASSLTMSMSNLMFNSGGQSTHDSKDAAETTPQFKPRSHYAQPYYQSTAGGSNQQPTTSGGSGQNSMGQSTSYGRNSVTMETRQNSLVENHYNSGYNQNKSPTPPPLLPNRMHNTNNDQYQGGGNSQSSMYGGGNRRSYGLNSGGGGGGGGGPPAVAPRQSQIDRPSRRNDEGGGLQYRDSRVYGPGQYDGGGVDDDPESSVLRRNTKYVNKESLYSFQQAMSDHFDHYKRPPSRDSSVDRYSRAASRLSGGSRQSSVEKSHQPRRGGDDPLSTAADKSYGGGGGYAKQNSTSPAVVSQHQPPFEEIILRQRNLGQEIVPSPVGQPKRTESLYVNPNAARKETNAAKSRKVSFLINREQSCCVKRSCGSGAGCYGCGCGCGADRGTGKNVCGPGVNGYCNAGCNDVSDSGISDNDFSGGYGNANPPAVSGVGTRKPRLLPPPPPPRPKRFSTS